jgi:protein-S-isoprenylcysteine O-methyltransferase Ste14
MESKQPKHQENAGVHIPKWTVPLVWSVIVLVIQILLPWVISNLGLRFGWSQQTPALWNFTGILAIIIGLVMYGWCLSFHFKTYKASVRLGFSPPQLVTNGPYQVSRNPMYVSGLFVWFGWVVFYGSFAVFIAFMLLYLLFSLRVIPHEERQLEELFGEDYLNYKDSVRRWFGRF